MTITAEDAAATVLVATADSGRMPRQIPYIIGNEACERFSFYGMRNILTPFLVTTLLLSAPLAERAGIAKDIFHTFVIGVYFFPLLGGWISDRFFGNYNTVLWLSMVYVVGHACLAIFEDMTNASVRSPAVIEQIAGTGLSETAFLMFFFAGFAFLASPVFALYARRYPMQDHYRIA